MIYKVNVQVVTTGIAYVEATSPGEAMEIIRSGDTDKFEVVEGTTQDWEPTDAIGNVEIIK
jgi:hypothetical protein